MSRVHRIQRRVGKGLQYMLMRHAIAVSNEERRNQRDGHRIFANSIPKSGTNLLTELLNQLPCVNSRWTYHIDETIPGWMRQLGTVKSGQVVTAHLPWEEQLQSFLEEKKFRKFLMVRDIRDIAVSGCHYVTHMDSSHLLHPYFQSLGSESERLLRYIQGVGDDAFPGNKRPEKWVDNFTSAFMPWLKDSTCLILRFEDLIGPAGGGTAALQRREVCRVLDHLDMQIDENEIDVICSRVFSTKARTFRKGQIGNWKLHFDEKHKEAFRARHQDALIALGYESNADW